MGNRAVITTPARELGIYLHWNGGRDTIEPLLHYCKLQGYRSPDQSNYGFARMCQVLGNFLGGSLSLGVEPYTTDDEMNPGDNGIYVIENWEIVERIGLWGEEQYIHDFHDMVKAFDDFMPEECRLGSYLNSTLIEPSRLQVGDEVWVHDFHRSPVKLLTISGFGDGTDSWEVGTPYADDVLESVITGKRERVRRYIQNADLIDGKIPLNPKH